MIEREHNLQGAMLRFKCSLVLLRRMDGLQSFGAMGLRPTALMINAIACEHAAGVCSTCYRYIRKYLIY